MTIAHFAGSAHEAIAAVAPPAVPAPRGARATARRIGPVRPAVTVHNAHSGGRAR